MENINEEFTDFQLEKIVEFRDRLNKIMVNPGEAVDEGLLNDIIIRFLRYKKFDVDAAMPVVMKALRLGIAEEIQKVPYEVYKKTYDIGLFVSFKKRAADGSKILLTRLKNWNPDEIDLITFIAGFYYHLDENLCSVKSQKNGISLIFDVSGTGVARTAKILSFFTVDIATQLANFFQGSYPMRIKAIHFINSPLILISFFACFKYLISKKMRDRLHLHYRGPQVLLKHFDKKVLPVSLNGSIPEEDAPDVKILKSVNKKGVSGASNILSLRKYFIIPN